MSSVEGEAAQQRTASLAPPISLDASTAASQTNNDASPGPKTTHAHSPPGSILAPSVQFDEQSLLASPSAQRRADNSSLPPSPAPGSTFLASSSATNTMASSQQRREPSASQQRHTAGPSHLRESQSHHRLSNRASAAGSSTSLTAGSRSGTGSKRSRANPTIVTVPVWARDESPSPPQSPYASPQARSLNRSVRDVESLSLPAAEIRTDDASQPAASSERHSETTEAGQAPDKAGVGFDRVMSPEAVQEAEAQEAQSTSPDRWWTFTLPQKYRSRLHEHHLRMAFHHEREQSDALEKASSNKQANRERSRSFSKKRSQQRRSSSDSSRSNASSSEDSSDIEMQQRGGRDQQDHSYDLGAGSWNGMAAGLGASGLLNNKRSETNPSNRRTARAGRGQADGEAAATLHDEQRQVSPSPDGTSTTRADDRDLEKQHKQDSEPEYPTMSFKARMEHPEVYTVHQPATPGWASPWKPEERGHGGLNAAGYFPRTESGRTIRSSDGRKSAWLESWKNFLIHNPFVPLLFRVINIAFTAATLAVAVKLLVVLQSEGANDAVGASPLLAIVFAPLTLLHVGFQIWLEYFGRPIGLWTVQSKLSYTVVELVFICLWSAELSLTFDNYFTSTLVCVTYGSPFVGPRQPPADRPNPLNNPGRKPFVCRLQGSLIGLVFVSLLAYLIVLTVSLFRIFVRVTGGGRR
ncbi:uncharacterized protein PAN0_001c0071 [Moesziomyces antarcticus]|uniref:Uncharacterized protein n=1 Tax=Pseudozyma antarctica TaxID=84753 RepID=A0A5C3FE68_PSEA2|nr:uncharacterized protein PAN0_001c0071 [Moesziomyces antarcticus]GAK61876.1 conserved hypothetical protein [Moesziomyces antarcticus]SPO42396.1 uncharacterized protein PSANT_00079 [Moesziomyces antarcticus]